MATLLDTDGWDLRAVSTDAIIVRPRVEPASSGFSFIRFSFVVWVKGVDAWSEEGDREEPWGQMHITTRSRNYFESKQPTSMTIMTQRSRLSEGKGRGTMCSQVEYVGQKVRRAELEGRRKGLNVWG